MLLCCCPKASFIARVGGEYPSPHNCQQHRFLRAKRQTLSGFCMTLWRGVLSPSLRFPPIEDEETYVRYQEPT